VNESAMNGSTLVTIVIDAETEQDTVVKDSQINTPPNASDFKHQSEKDSTTCVAPLPLLMSKTLYNHITLVLMPLLVISLVDFHHG